MAMKQNIDDWRYLLSGLALWLFCGHIAPVVALPEGADVIAGDIHITTQQHEMRIQQSTQRGIIHYDDFDIGEHETVIFQQPDNQSVTLNRILGHSRSDIFGEMHSNGHIFLLNPNGILFSESSQIDVGGMVASTLDMTDENFNRGHFLFEGDSSMRIENRGDILSSGGYIAIIGNDVSNTGNIHSDAGQVGLFSGRQVVIGYDNETVAYAVSELTDTAHIHNSGTITGDLGVALDVHSRDQIENRVINNEGIIHASGFALQGGEIIISSTAGSIVNSGAIAVDHSEAMHERAGEIIVASERFVNFGTVAANAISEGAGGSIDIHTSDALYLADGSLTEANGAGSGDGGTIIHYSDNATWFAPGAQSNARAGDRAGEGGFIEMSGRHSIAYAGTVDVTAKNGDDGWLFIDPSNIDIANVAGTFVAPGSTGATITIDPMLATSFVSASVLEQTLLSGNNVRISTANTNTVGEEGTLTVVDEIDLTGVTGQSLILQSNSDMAINANICASNGGGGCVSGAHDTNLRFETFAGDGGSISLADDILIDSGGGTIAMDADVNIVLGENSALESSGSLINLTANNTIVLPDSGLSTAGTLSMVAGDVLDRSGRTLDIQAGRIDLALNNPLGDVTINGQIFGIDVALGAPANFILNALQSPVNTISTVDIHDINLVDGDFSLNIVGGRNTDINLINYTSLNNISLINPSRFGHISLPGGIDIAGDVSLQSSAIQDSFGVRNYSIRANTLNLNTLSFGTPETVTTDVNTLRLAFSSERIQHRLTINEADAVVISDLTQNGISDLRINAGGDITFNNQADLSHVGDAALPHRLAVTSSGGSITLNTGLMDSDVNQNTSTLITLDAANDIVFSANTQTDSNGGAITLRAGGLVSIGDSAVVDAGDALFSLNANAIVTDGTLISDSADSQAMMLLSNTDITGSGSGLLRAQNGGLVLNAQTGIDVDTSAAFLDAQNTSAGNVVIREMDALALTNIATTSGASITLASGELMIPDAGVRVPDRLTLIADSITNAAGNPLSIEADALVFSANNVSENVVLNANVRFLDARTIGQDLTIINQNSLNILDLNGDAQALEVHDGIVTIEALTGDLTVNDNIRVRDVSADGDRTGLLVFQVNAGDVRIGDSGPTSIDIESLLDSGNSSTLNNAYSNNAVAIIHQNDSSRSVSQLGFGNGSGDSVNLRVRGGDFVADFYDEVGGIEHNNIVINSGVRFDVGGENSGLDNGYLFAQGVDTSLAEFAIGRENSVYLIRELQPLVKLGRGGQDILSELYPTSLDADVIEEPVSIVQGASVDAILGFEHANCGLLGDGVKGNQCRVEQAYRRFLNTFLVSGQLPSSEEFAVER